MDLATKLIFSNTVIQNFVSDTTVSSPCSLSLDTDSLYSYAIITLYLPCPFSKLAVGMIVFLWLLLLFPHKYVCSCYLSEKSMHFIFSLNSSGSVFSSMSWIVLIQLRWKIKPHFLQEHSKTIVNLIPLLKCFMYW